MLGDPPKTDHKTTKLCRQVEEAVAYALAASADAVLRDLYVVSVEPLRGAARLRVLVTIEGESTDYDNDEISERLDRANGYLRSEVARGTHRKRVPILDVVFVPAWSEVE